MKKYYDVKRNCDYCKKLYYGYRYNVNKKQYCCNSCSIRDRRDVKNSVTKNCFTCNKLFTSWNSQKRKFCSKQCANLHRHNKTPWYTVCGYRCQGTYEALFILWCIKTNLKFDAHPISLKYQDENGNDKNYYPDFFIDDWDSYVEIKSEWTKKLSHNKMKQVKLAGHSVKILTEKEMLKLGVNITRKDIEETRDMLKKKNTIDVEMWEKELGRAVSEKDKV